MIVARQIRPPSWPPLPEFDAFFQYPGQFDQFLKKIRKKIVKKIDKSPLLG
jgi:hypothetical protein